MTNIYAKAYTEVLEIINHFLMDKDYVFYIDSEIDLLEQNTIKK